MTGFRDNPLLATFIFKEDYALWVIHLLYLGFVFTEVDHAELVRMV